VLVIADGRLHFDGALAALVAATAPARVVSAVFAEPVAPAAVAPAREGRDARLDPDGLRLSLEAPRAEVADLAGRLLRLGPVADLSIEDVPVEEIVRRIFRAGAAGAPAGAGEVGA
jgi:ABC-2 type transport system ATP-binding protein